MPKECGKVPAHYCDSIHRGNLAEKKWPMREKISFKILKGWYKVLLLFIYMYLRHL